MYNFGLIGAQFWYSWSAFFGVHFWSWCAFLVVGVHFWLCCAVLVVVCSSGCGVWFWFVGLVHNFGFGVQFWFWGSV